MTRRLVLLAGAWFLSPIFAALMHPAEVRAAAAWHAELQGGPASAEELRLAQNALNEITGEFTSDDLLGVIFSSFCIGK